MNKALLIISALTLMIGCTSGGKSGGSSGGVRSSSETRGEIIAKPRSVKYNPLMPYGMVPIPSGAFVVGQADYEFSEAGDAAPKTVTVQSFFMDDTEITNLEYKDFVYYVRDSVVRQALAEKVEELGNAEEEEGIAMYAFFGQKEKDKDESAYQLYLKENTNDREGGFASNNKLNWEEDLYWNIEDYPDVPYAEIMEGFYFPPEDRIEGKRELDITKFNYRFSWVDIKSAAQNKFSRRSDYIITEEFNIYPDTTVWERDFLYSYNEPMHRQYFWHEAYDDYPVVGVNWDQANAFCHYKTEKHNVYLSSAKNKDKVFEYRLPTEVEWEYAARGGLNNAPFPWGGPYLTDDKGCYLANFKPKRGDYIEGCTKEGGFIYTSPVRTFRPNIYGLYDMAGNVSEWTNSPYEISSYNLAVNLNPDLSRLTGNLNKVVRGGSWKDFGYLLQNSYRTYENRDSARSYVGFRTVQTIPEGTIVKFPTKVKSR